MVVMFSCCQACAEQTPAHGEVAEFFVLQCPSPIVFPLPDGSADAGETPCAAREWALWSYRPVFWLCVGSTLCVWDP